MQTNVVPSWPRQGLETNELLCVGSVQRSKKSEAVQQQRTATGVDGLHGMPC